MTPLQTAEIRAGELRIRLAELGGMAELTEETRAELDTLRTEYTDTERRMAALKISEPDRTPIESRTSEGTEYRSMLDRANLGTIFDVLMAHQNPTGVEAELQQHLHLAGNQIPLDMLRGNGGGGGRMEERAVTPGATNVGSGQQPIVSYVFPQSAAAYLNVAMPTVPVGDAVFPVLTGTLSVGTPAENANQAETTGSFSSDVLTPSRIQASFFYSREDSARFAGMDAALRENLSDGLADGLDDQILSGTNGLFTGTNLPNNNITTDDTFDTYLNHLCWDQIDGRYAAMTSDLAMVVGAATFKDLGGTYRNDSVDRSALDRLMELTSGVRVSAHVPGPASNRQNVVIRRGMSATAVAPTWEGVTIIPDEIIKAGTGQIVITAVMLYAMKVLRTGAGLIKQGTDHS